SLQGIRSHDRIAYLNDTNKAYLLALSIITLSHPFMTEEIDTLSLLGYSWGSVFVFCHTMEYFFKMSVVPHLAGRERVESDVFFYTLRETALLTMLVAGIRFGLYFFGESDSLFTRLKHMGLGVACSFGLGFASTCLFLIMLECYYKRRSS